ncbi:hypothetical protein RYR42_003638 [Edwardsiella piscicida]|nr:hypothetical protein [Edwardsiella piscicida]
MKVQLNDNGEVFITVTVPFFDVGSSEEALTLPDMVADVVIKRKTWWPRRYEITGRREDVIKVWDVLNIFND